MEGESGRYVVPCSSCLVRRAAVAPMAPSPLPRLAFACHLSPSKKQTGEGRVGWGGTVRVAGGSPAPSMPAPHPRHQQPQRQLEAQQRKRR